MGGSDARLVDAYLLCYISMFILYLFYGSRNKNPKQREFLRSTSWLRNWTGALPWPWKTALRQPRWRKGTPSILLEWRNCGIANRIFEKGRKTKVGTILNACRLLERRT